MPKFLKLKPIQKTLLVLVLISLGSLINAPLYEVVPHFLSIIITALLAHLFFSKISKKKKSYENTIITALIIALTLSYQFTPLILGSELVLPALISALAIAIKFYLKIKGQQIFNPAVLALFLAVIIIPDSFVSWWGTNYKISLPGIEESIPLALIITLLWAIFWLNQWRKRKITLVFLICYWILAAALSGVAATKFVFTDGTIYFFAAIMLIDPKTSPILKHQQISFAALAAISYAVLLKLNLPAYDLAAILIANLAFFLQKNIKAKKSPAKA